MEDAGNNVEVDETLFQVTDDLQLRMMRMIQTTIGLIQRVTCPTSELSLSAERLDYHSICGYAKRVLIFLSFF